MQPFVCGENLIMPLTFSYQVNEVCLWEYDPFVNHDDPAILSEPKKIYSCDLSASVTDMVFTEQDFVVASCTSGTVMLYKYCSLEKVSGDQYSVMSCLRKLVNIDLQYKTFTTSACTTNS